MNTYSYKDCHIAPVIKDLDGRKGIVTGYFSHFGNVDADGDIIVQGAFTKTINESGPKSSKFRIKHLFNHDPSQPLGVIQELKEDTIGLYYESKVGSHGLGQDFIKMVDSGLINEHSIGFQTLQKSQIQSWEEYQKNKEKGHQQITQIKLWEGSSLSAWGANEMTPMTGMKDLKDKSEQIAKFCKDSKATDETIEMLLLYNSQLVQMINDLQTKQPAQYREGEVMGASNVVTISAPTHTTAIVPDEVKIPDVVECPKCKSYNYTNAVDYIKCRNCNKTFVIGSKVTIDI